MAAASHSETIDLIELLPKQMWIECARDIPNGDKPKAQKLLQQAVLKAAAKIWPVCAKAKNAKKAQLMTERQAKLTKPEKDKLQDKCQQGRADMKERKRLLAEEVGEVRRKDAKFGDEPLEQDGHRRGSKRSKTNQGAVVAPESCGVCDRMAGLTEYIVVKVAMMHRAANVADDAAELVLEQGLD